MLFNESIVLFNIQVEQQKKQKEQALIVSDAYRVAFEEQLIKNRSFVLNCSKSCSDNSDMGPVNSLKIKMAKVLRCKSVSEGKSKFLSIKKEVKSYRISISKKCLFWSLHKEYKIYLTLKLHWSSYLSVRGSIVWYKLMNN